MEREAGEDYSSGRYRSFDSAEAFQQELERVSEQAERTEESQRLSSRLRGVSTSNPPRAMTADARIIQPAR